MYILLPAVFVDLIMGDPEIYPHPVVLMGKLISGLDSFFRQKTDSNAGQRWAGFLLVVIVLTVTFLLTFWMIELAYRVHGYLGLAVNIWLLSTTVSVKGLAEAGKEVYHLLSEGDLTEARRSVGRIVGRDTEKMSPPEIVRATVETIAENTSDGVIAPLFFYLLGGTPLAMTYKAVNTMDSMLGYKNETYQHLGRAAAVTDDIANFLPARLTGLDFVLAAFILRLDWRLSWRIMLRDASRHDSPNAGYPEAAVAGALNVRLGGLNYYQGRTSFKEYLGEKRREFEYKDIISALKLMYGNVFIILILFNFLLILKMF